MNRVFVRLALILFVLTVAMAGFAQRPGSTAIKLANSDPNLPNQLLPQGINNRGDVVGHIGDERDGVGFVISANGQQETFVFPGQCDPLQAPGMCTYPHGINDRGEIVGNALLAGGSVAFLRQKSGVMTTLPLAPDNSVLTPSSINDRGAIAGSYGSHCFILSAGELTTIDFPGASSTSCTGINHSGLVTGFYASDGSSHGFVWDKGNFVATFQISNSNGPLNTFPTGINDRGQISIPGLNSANPSPTAFVRNPDGTITTIDLSSLLQPIGGVAGVLTGINKRGDLVGWFSPSLFNIFGFVIPNGSPAP